MKKYYKLSKASVTVNYRESFTRFCNKLVQAYSPYLRWYWSFMTFIFVAYPSANLKLYL